MTIAEYSQSFTEGNGILSKKNNQYGSVPGEHVIRMKTPLLLDGEMLHVHTANLICKRNKSSGHIGRD